MLITALLVSSLLAQPAKKEPPNQGKGTVGAYSYTFQRESIYVALDSTPMLPAKQAVLFDVMRTLCHDLWGVDVSKIAPYRVGQAWAFERKDLQRCFGRAMPSPLKTGEIKWMRVWVP